MLLWVAALHAVEPRFLTGVDASHAVGMEADGRGWTVDGAPVDVFGALADAGADTLRVRLWVGDEGPSGLREALATARRGQDAGMRVMVVMFLSDGWADLVRQPAPPAWRDQPEAAQVEAIGAYAARAARAFLDAGVQPVAWSVGNEIDFGLSGVFEEAWPRRVSVDWMRQQIWPGVAARLVAAQGAIRAVQPEARFVVHLGRWWEPEYDLACWQALAAAGVAVDVPAVSWYPSGPGPELHEEAGRGVEALSAAVGRVRDVLGRRVLIAEAGYPAAPAFPGPFWDWNHPLEAYPLDPDGQAAWLADTLRVVRRDRDFAGFILWSPEWYGGGVWDAFALFGPDGAARPALGALRRGAWRGR